MNPSKAPMRITPQGAALANDIMAKNKVIKDGRKRDSVRNACDLADETVNDHFKYVKRGAVSTLGGFGPGTARQIKCHICNEHDSEMISGTGPNDGAWYCREHKSMRGLKQTEQDNERKKYVNQ